MRIENLTEEKTDYGKRVSASVYWEDCSRPSQEIYFETDEEHADELICTPHAFLVACLIPAMDATERRIKLEGMVCPKLLEGLQTVMSIMHHWSPSQMEPLKIDADSSYSPTQSPRRRAGSFLSGGVDSLATVRMNRMLYPSTHSCYFHECLIVQGFDIGHEDPRLHMDLFQRATTAASKPAAEVGVDLIPVITNVRTLNNGVGFWMEKFVGAALASVAHALSGQLTSVAIPSSFDVPHLIPLATHPMLDPYYSSSELQILHDGVRLSRLAKIRILAEWPTALENLRVCTMNDPNYLNCGRCEKCIRTMTALLALEKLDQSPAFPGNSVPADLLNTIKITHPYQDVCYRELIPLLRECGRHDLVTIIGTKSDEFHRFQKWFREEDWKGVIKRADRRWLGAGTYRLYAYLRKNYHRLTISR